MQGKTLIWMASYPKSGNTWFRSFLTAVMKGEVDINDMVTHGIFSGKEYIESTLDLELDDLTDRELEKFRKIAIVHLHQKGESIRFLKIHDAFTYSVWGGEPILPNLPNQQAIYLIRNPLDVALSFANHNGQEVQETIDTLLCSSNGAMVKRSKAGNQIKQRLGTWAMHVESWIEQTHIPVHVLRYEDMKSDPLASFSNAVEFMGLSYSSDQIQKAIELTRFERLKAQEQEKGFKEKSAKSKSFFHQGQIDRWKEELTLKQIEKIMKSNEKMMRKFGYWDEAILHLNK